MLSLWCNHYLNQQITNKVSKEKNKEAKNLDPDFDKEKAKLQKFDNKGLQTLFRTLMRNHYNLLRIIDNKASNMLTVNSIIISIMMGIIYVAPTDIGDVLEIGAKILLNFGMASMTFALFAMVPHRYIGLRKAKNNSKGSLYAPNFAKLTLEQYRDEMQRIIATGESIYNEMIDDLYFLGKTISLKQKMILVSIVIFFVGLILSIVHTLSHGVMIEKIFFQN